MAVFPIEKTWDYTVLPNHHLRNTALLLKAKGILLRMLPLPEDWDYTTRVLPGYAGMEWTASTSSINPRTGAAHDS